jgi:hypothetical protein
MKNRGCLVWGIVIGVGGTWAYHKWVKPLPGGSAASKSGSSGY